MGATGCTAGYPVANARGFPLAALTTFEKLGVLPTGVLRDRERNPLAVAAFILPSPHERFQFAGASNEEVHAK
jgi:hypothetical protein